MIFSVAVPVLKHAEFVPTALASLAAQSCTIQLALMDATPDQSVQSVLAGYSDLFHYLRHGPDKGQSAAIQEGWDHTTGEILHWLCADDYLFPYAFQEVEQIFLERPDVDVVYGDSVFVDREGQFLSYFPSISRDIADILRGCCISQPSCFVRRRAFERVGRLNGSLNYIMDWDLWTRLFKGGAKFHYLNKPLAAVRMYRATKTWSGSRIRLSEIRNHLIRHNSLFTAVRPLINFYYDALEHRSNSVQDRLAFRALALLRWMKLRFAVVGDPINTTLYGLEKRTNRVRGKCEIYIPWYGSVCPRTIAVGCHGAGNLSATVNGFESRCVRGDCSGEDCRYVFEIPSSEQFQAGFFCITLKQPDTLVWRLLSLNIQ